MLKFDVLSRGSLFLVPTQRSKTHKFHLVRREKLIEPWS